VAQQLEQDRRAFDIKLFEISQKVQEDSRAIAERGDTFTRKITWFFIILAVLKVVGTLLAFFFPNGFFGG